MIENLSDRKCGGQTLIHGEELACWERLCFKCGIMDAWYSPSVMKLANSLAFSRSDRRNEGANIARLDKFYLSNLLQESGGFIGIIPGITFSDHAPVSLCVLDERESSDVHFRIADALINNVHFEPRMQGIWNRFEVLEYLTWRSLRV